MKDRKLIIKYRGEIYLKEELIIYQKYSDLINYAYGLITKYPKSEKFAMVVEIRKNMFETLQKILLISHNFDGVTKLKILNELDALIGMHKFYIRFSYNQKYSKSFKLYESIIEKFVLKKSDENMIHYKRTEK